MQYESNSEERREWTMKPERQFITIILPIMNKGVMMASGMDSEGGNRRHSKEARKGEGSVMGLYLSGLTT